MHGCNGKMGQVITKIAEADSKVEIVAGVDQFQGVQNPYPVFSSMEACDAEADVVIDFSNAAAVDGLLDYCVNRQLPVVLCTTGLSEAQLEKVEKAAELTPAIPVTSPSTMPGYKEVAPDQVPANAIQMGAGRLVIAIGSDPFNMTMMTANAGGSIGKISGSPVVFSILSPDQPYEQLEKAETYSIRFYPTGQKEPSVILECQKLPAPTPMEGQPRTYAGKITKAFMK